MIAALFGRREVEVPCTVEVANTFDSLHAHVDLAREYDINPGDAVTVHGEEIHAAYGEAFVLERRATVSRAGWLERAWTRIVGNFEFMELLDISFSDRRKL
jgi:mannose-6-phosphate isomerase class I